MNTLRSFLHRFFQRLADHFKPPETRPVSSPTINALSIYCHDPVNALKPDNVIECFYGPGNVPHGEAKQ